MSQEGSPEGDVYDWFRRAAEFLDRGDAGASLMLIERVIEADPTSAAAREIRARALFDTAHFAEAAEAFSDCLARRPDDDYAHYGLGMSLWRLQEFPQARDHLAMASVMRPDQAAYSQALTQVRATIKARRKAGMPLSGPIDSPPILGIDTMVATYPDVEPESHGPRPATDFWPPSDHASGDDDGDR